MRLEKPTRFSTSPFSLPLATLINKTNIYILFTADDKDSLAQYENWKARFPMDINSYLKQQLNELNEIYEVQKLIDNGINTDWEKKNYESYFHLLEDEWKMIRFD